MLGKSLWGLALAISLVGGGVSRATVMELTPIEDRSAADGPVGAVGALRDGTFDAFLSDEFSFLAVGDYREAGESRAAFEFGIPAELFSVQITSARLEIETIGVGHGDVDPVLLRVDSYAATGIIGLATYSVDNLLAVYNFGTLLHLRRIDFDVTSEIRETLQKVSGQIGFVVRTLSPGVSFGFASVEHEFVPYRPQLRVEYAVVPEPCTLALVLPAPLLISLIWKAGLR